MLTSQHIQTVFTQDIHCRLWQTSISQYGNHNIHIFGQLATFCWATSHSQWWILTSGTGQHSLLSARASWWKVPAYNLRHSDHNLPQFLSLKSFKQPSTGLTSVSLMVSIHIGEDEGSNYSARKQCFAGSNNQDIWIRLTRHKFEGNRLSLQMCE